MASSTRQLRPRRDATNCKICDGLAMYSYVGVLVCASCKMFFRRNAQRDQSSWRCRSNGRCDVNIHHRPLCSVCRMKKCLALGMTTDLFRASQPRRPRCNASSSITTVSLLQSDSSTLSSEQWTHLSNIVHCYDEYSLQSAAVRYVQEQSRLPVRIRFHSSSLHNLFVQLMTAGQFLFKNNGDFVTFVPSDQSLIVQNAAKMVAGFSLTLIGSTSKIFVTPVCRETLDNIYGKSASDSCQHAGKRLDTDETFVKLMISALIFSTFRCTEYMEGADSNTISDVKTLLRIQNQYIEIAWRYMVYKYDHQRAVRGFSNLILSLMHLHESLVEVSRVEKFNQTVDSLIEKSLDMSISKT